MIILRDKVKLKLSKLKTKADSWIEDKRTGLKGIDVAGLGSGHISCSKCGSNFFHVNLDLKNDKVITSCTKCSNETRLLFPVEAIWAGANNGDLNCPRKHKVGMALIKCDETFCIGCGQCEFEIRATVYNDAQRIIRV